MARKPIDTIEQVRDLGINAVFVLGTPGGIEREEKAGQDYLVSQAQMLPKDMRGQREKFERLGFKFGENIDDIFVEGTLPEGWSKKGSDHSMWSYIIDDKGRERVAIFYKAAFYDRSAHMHLNHRFHVTTSRHVKELREGPSQGVVLDADNSVVWSTGPLPREEMVGKREWDIDDILTANAYSWLAQHYPNYDDPLAHWD